MSKYRKRPVVIDAVQLSEQGTLKSPWPEWIGDATEAKVVVARGDCIVIKTAEGEMTASPLDWIIRGVAGELYPCKPEIFEATYEPALDEKTIDKVLLAVIRDGYDVAAAMDVQAMSRLRRDHGMTVIVLILVALAIIGAL